MTINDLRDKYPNAPFNFFDADGWMIKKTPFLHEEVLRYYKKYGEIFIFLNR